MEHFANYADLEAAAKAALAAGDLDEYDRLNTILSEELTAEYGDTGYEDSAED